jgi:acetoacetyl-CoA synthetase
LADTTLSDVLWTPPSDAWTSTNLGRFLSTVGTFDSYEAAWRWSVDDLEVFWAAVWRHYDVLADGAPDTVLGDRSMPGAVWFPDVRINYAEHALRVIADGDIAVIGRSQTRGPVDLTRRELRDQVARARAGLRRLGVGPGDRVAAYLPNIPETLVAFLATASLGAIWSSCAPEFGIRSVIDRFGQIEPTVLLAADGYRYGSKLIERHDEVEAIRAALPSVRTVVGVPYLGRRIVGGVSWDDLLHDHEPLDFERLRFDHPLYVLYTSGTTGLPKPIVHGHGGITLEHLKQLGLMKDLGPGDRAFWFSTTGWMMWNFCISALLVGASVVLYDGDPTWPDLRTLWTLAEETGMTLFGASAPFMMSCRRAGLEPGRHADLSTLRLIGSTGAPLPPEGFHWIYESVKGDVPFTSSSGGTDVCTAFVGGTRLVPVYAGEIPCRYLGAKVEAFDEEGRSVVGVRGELVLSEPMPSMPVGLWGDTDGSRYRTAYFERFPGVWSHGDWVTITERGGVVITGRSDATLNRGGVRLGTAELYSVVEAVEGVTDSLVVHLEDDDGGPGRLLLFVVLAEGVAIDDIRSVIAASLRRELSPRHVPDEVIAVRAIPRTLTGKKLEVPVKRILQGVAADVAASRDALADPAALDDFVHLAATRPD